MYAIVYMNMKFVRQMRDVNTKNDLTLECSFSQSE